MKTHKKHILFDTMLQAERDFSSILLNLKLEARQ